MSCTTPKRHDRGLSSLRILVLGVVAARSLALDLGRAMLAETVWWVRPRLNTSLADNGCCCAF